MRLESIEGGTPILQVPAPWTWFGRPNPSLSRSGFDAVLNGIVTIYRIEGTRRWFVVPDGGLGTVSRHGEAVGGARDDAREHRRRRIPLFSKITLPAGTLFRIDRTGASDRTAQTTVIWGVRMTRQLSDSESCQLNGLLVDAPDLVGDFLIDCDATQA